jgi:nanoRNase/pAp phosphatase (c-di-AMP/oligoRNAs hydrolase)
MTNKKENKALTLINDAKTIAIVPSKVAGADSFSAAVGLYYMLLEKDKDVYFVYQGKIPEAGVGLIESDRISSNVTQREVVVKVDYSGTAAGQAHYATEDDVLEIRLGPVPKDFDLDRVRARLTGFDFDLIIVVGAQEVADLGSTYTKLKEEFSEAKVINIDNTKRNKKFGDVNVVEPSASTLSVLLFSKASEWKLVPTEKAAQALLTGMTYRNTNFAID